MNQLENSVFVAFKDRLQVSTAINLRTCIIFQPLAAKAVHKSSSLKQLIFLSIHTRTHVRGNYLLVVIIAILMLTCSS